MASGTMRLGERMVVLIGCLFLAERLARLPESQGGSTAQQKCRKSLRSSRRARAGNVYVADGFPNSRVLKLPTGSTTPVQLPFTGLQTTATTIAGNVYVTDNGNNRVLKLSKGTTTPVQLPRVTSPDSMAIDTAGNVYVLDRSTYHIVKLSVGSSEWTPLPFGDLDNIWGVAVDAAGNVYTAAKTDT